MGMIANSFWSDRAQTCGYKISNEFKILVRSYFKHRSNSRWFMIDRIFVNLAGNDDMDKISDELDIRPDQTISFGITHP